MTGQGWGKFFPAEENHFMQQSTWFTNCFSDHSVVQQQNKYKSLQRSMRCCIFHLFWQIQMPRTNHVAFGCHAQHVRCFLHFLFLVACIVTNCKNIQITMGRSSSSCWACFITWLNQTVKEVPWKEKGFLKELILWWWDKKWKRKASPPHENTICNEERLLSMLLFLTASL